MTRIHADLGQAAWPRSPMCLMVHRKACRCGQLIDVGTLSPSCLGVGWTGRVACSYISQHNSTTQVQQVQVRGCILR